MTTIKRFTGILIGASMLCVGLMGSVAFASPISFNVSFDAPDLPNGSTYVLTIDSTTYNITAITGIDMPVFAVPAGNTITVTYSRYAYESDSKRRDIGAQPAPASFTVNGPVNVSQNYPFTEIKLTADQTGLPVGTEYSFNHMMAISTDILTAGTPFDFWTYISGGEGYVVFDFQNPVPTKFGLYPLVSTVPESGFAFTVPRTIMATYASGSISGYVFNDYNNNGVMDPGETGVSGATVQLWGGGNPVQESGQANIQAISDALSVFQTGTSGDNGLYTFNGVPAGSFYVRALLPNGSQQDSAEIVLTISGTGVTSGAADFPELATLPYTGI